MKHSKKLNGKSVKIIMPYLRKLQRFNNKRNNGGLKSLCNFNCNPEDKFKRINLPKIYNKYDCLHRPNNNIREYTDNEYFKDLEGGHDYFIQKYEQNFNSEILPYNSSEWNNIIDNIDGPAHKIIFGPAELLAPFTNNDWYGLSHPNWTPNLNFNYLIHMLYLVKTIFFIIPSYDNVHIFNISSWCNTLSQNNINKENNELRQNLNKEKFARATMNELVLLSFLEDSGLIKIKYENIDVGNNSLITHNDNTYRINKYINNVRTKNDCDNTYNKETCGPIYLKENTNNNNNNNDKNVTYKFQILRVKIKKLKFKKEFKTELKQYSNKKQKSSIFGY